ncbi:MAG: alpha-amylase family glycosyl hydrolase [Myxococcota bacterium]
MNPDGPFPVEALAALPEDRRTTVLRRADPRWRRAVSAMSTLYGARADAEDLPLRVAMRLADAVSERRDDLWHLDAERERTPDWFLKPDMLGYSTYVDRFADDLRGLTDRLDYLTELGVTYLHLLPLYPTQPGDSDGGFAVANHRAVHPRLGSEADLVALSKALRARGISLGLDFVLNHTAEAHPWAQAAQQGNQRFRSFYLTFEDRSLPDQYETTLTEVFPSTAPGHFTWNEALQRYVWTTFYPFQWDLDWTNPQVFEAMLDTALWLANVGGEVLRLDSAAFLWKRLGTDGRNQPEVHLVLQAFRALLGIVAPGVLLKAEAIVAAREVVPYFGRQHAPGCDLAYHNTLMASLWYGLATGDPTLVERTISQTMPPSVPSTTWATYLRCHDDIGWWPLIVELGAEADARLAEVAAFYAGERPGSFAWGRSFQSQEGDAHGTNGMLASLVGLQRALEITHPTERALAVARIRLLHGLLLGLPGLPVLYMGDEIGLGNDPAEAARQADGRWLHRPRFPWSHVHRRLDPATPEGQVWSTLRTLISHRRAQPALHSEVAAAVVPMAAPSVVAIRRSPNAGAPLLILGNLSSEERTIDDLPDRFATSTDVLSGVPFDGWLPPYHIVWLTSDD